MLLVFEAMSTRSGALRKDVGVSARLGVLDGWLPDPELDSPEEVDSQVAQLIDDFVEPAKVHGLEKLDEGRSAIAIANRWIRPKLQGELGAGQARVAEETDGLSN